MTQWGLEAIFNPGKRFDDDERRRLEATREEAGDSSGGKRIDLGSGRVVIARPTASEDRATDEDGASDSAAPDAAATGGAEAPRDAAANRAKAKRAQPPSRSASAKDVTKDSPAPKAATPSRRRARGQ